jgi:AcrR family transcriptional regulator
VASSPAPDRPLRADAERNRRRLLDSAGELFATKGLSVGLDEIARHAGVGVATAYRRFPDKALLIDALLEAHVDRLLELAREALEVDDPWTGLVGFMEATVEVNATNRGVKELLFSGRHRLALVGEARRRLMAVVDELVRRAQANGDLRSDVEVTDMPLIQFMVSSLGDLGGPHPIDLWRRYLGIVLDGLHTPRPRPLATPPLTPAAFVEAIGKSRP